MIPLEDGDPGSGRMPQAGIASPERLRQADDLSQWPSPKLLEQYAAILTELVSRGAVRSRNAPVGDLAETLVKIAYGGELAPASAKSWDIRANGRRLQVKARLVAASGSRSKPQLSPFRTWDFDALVVVLFDETNYRVSRAIEIPSDAARSLAHDVKWVAGQRVMANDKLMHHGQARDVTAELQAALDQLDDYLDRRRA